MIALVIAALTIVYPWPGAHLPSVARSFAFGAAPPGSAVTVNGVAAHSGRGGGWIAYLPLRPGRFTLHVVAVTRRPNSTASADRTIDVDAPLTTTPAAPAMLDPAFAPEPDRALVVRPGELIRLAVKASAYSRVTATIGTAIAEVPLTGDFQRGLYRALVRAPSMAPAGALRVRYVVTSSDGSSASADARGSVTVEQTPIARVGVVAPWHDDDGTQAYGIVMHSPGSDYFMFPPAGTPFTIVGAYGDFYSVALGPTQRGFIYRKRLALKPPDSPVPDARVIGIDVRTDAHATRLIVHLSGRVPFQLVDDAAGASLLLRLFGAGAASRAVDYGVGTPGVRTVSWPAAPAGTLDMRVALRQRTLWGYEARWSGEDLVIRVKRPPLLSPEPGRAVSGLLVVVDPGHAPDSGAVGPLGTVERDVNLAIAKRLVAHLQALGARTRLTRSDATGIGLYDRVGLAARAGADVLISVHNNAWPDGVDPATHHGYSVYYYRTQSRDLARAVRSSYARDSGLPDAGMLVDDLALARPTEQPSVLTESAFITWPDEEELLRTTAYQDRLGAMIARGIEEWAEARRSRERQQTPAAARTAPKPQHLAQEMPRDIRG